MTKIYEELKQSLVKTQNSDKINEILCKMSQKNETFINKVISQDEIDNLKPHIINLENFEISSSLNQKSCLNKNTKLVIVGTVTPWNGKEFGYFYTSGVNKVYGIIDKFFGLSGTENSLVAFKKQLSKENDNENKEKIINKIIDVLVSNNIAFIDVASVVVRQKLNARDDKILVYSLDYESFKNANHVSKFICTSKNTKDCLDIIFNKLNFDNSKVVVCNQGWPHYKWEVWESELSKIFKNDKKSIDYFNP